MNKLTEFEKDTLLGLSCNPKFLLSKYFYDDNGSKIFQNIMRMPEYYLTDVELEIFESQKQEILDVIIEKDLKFKLIELGAGDGLKTKVLLSYFVSKKCDFEYVPIDISAVAVSNLLKDMKKQIPLLKVAGKIGDYLELIDEINISDKMKKIFLFLGSNIGNFNQTETIDFLSKLYAKMAENDLLFIGFDLKKEPDIILKAYNDEQGYTAAFNLNLLKRINREMDAGFEMENFRHEEVYNRYTGTAKSFLISLKNQDVYFKKLNKVIEFKRDERIFTEMSQKYDLDMINFLAATSGFKIVRNFFDSRQYYVNSLWIKS